MEGSILVIDDEVDVRDQLEGFLTQQGYAVRLAINGRDALTKLEMSVPNVIILDIMMPVMDGFDFLELIGAKAACASIPIVAISSGAIFPKTSANIFPLLKPFELDVLAETVKRAIEAHRKHQSAS